MRYALDSLVRTSAQQEKESASPENGPDCSERSCVQLTLSDQIGSFWKTVQESGPEADELSSVSLWREDIPGETECLARLTLGHYTRGTDGGALLPTLTVCGNYNRKGASKTSWDGLETVLRKLLPTLAATDHKSPYSMEGYRNQRLKRSKPLRDTLAHDIGTRITPIFAEWFMGWPIGHTASGVSETAMSRSARRRRGDCLRGRNGLA
jgi:hypothetical protein